MGVDVMCFKDKPAHDVAKFFHLLRRQFTSSEWAVIREDESESIQMRQFYRYWCLKESFVKADGKGLAWDLQRLAFKVGRDKYKTFRT